MIWPSWLWVGTPLKFILWLSNRVATWMGSFFLWKRFRARRAIWGWLMFFNIISLSALGLLFFCLHQWWRH